MKQVIFFVLFIVGIVFSEVISDYMEREYNGKKLCLVKEHGRFFEWSQKYAAKKAGNLNKINPSHYFFVEAAGTSSAVIGTGVTSNMIFGSSSTMKYYTVLEFSECR